MGKYQLSRPSIRSNPAAQPIEKTVSDSQHIVEVIYREQIPEFVAATLIRLYDNVYCTLSRIEAYDSLQGINTYVRRIDSKIQTIILFRERDGAVSVVNQQITLTSEDIKQFAAKIFQEYKRAQTISFYALDLSPGDYGFPSQHLDALEENVIFFPSCAEEYLKTFKGQFRKQLRVFNEQLLADQPGYQIKIFTRKQINEDFVRAILCFAAQRMYAKGKSDYTRDIEIEVLTRMLRTCGHMAVAFIGDKICGGAMWFSVGKRHFHQLAAHDPTYDRYMLGNQIWLAAILYSLRLGGTECWLMGGSSAHKARFGAKKKTLHSFILYRSTWHILLNCERYITTWAKHTTHAVKAALKEISTKPNFAGRSLKKMLLIAGSFHSVSHHITPGD